MLSAAELQVRRTPEPGWSWLVPPGQMRHLALGRLRLSAGERWTRTVERGREAVLVLLQGTGDLRAASERAPARRTDVWSDPAWGAYAPAGESLALEASEPLEAVLASADAAGHAPPRLLRPEDVRSRTVGEGAYERRVCDLLGSDQPAGRLVCGETFNPPGHWSSFPPHCHERHAPPEEAEMEEIYYYRLRPPEGFALQRIYGGDGSYDVALTIRDGDAVKIPRGYHPVAAMPGYHLYYFWVLAGQQRELRPHTDPDYAWLLR